ncbi:MAG: hypothetical protein GTO03_14330 [Planctomycetales bacterium]|nr:hypothetical protein [Planctomycetales bacterium]
MKGRVDQTRWPYTVWRWLLVANVAALLALAVFFRGWRLDHVPGVNGDEAWIGVQALRWLDGQSPSWRTPTGNPINVFHFLPQVCLHRLLPPSITLLRMPVLVSGLLALVVNYVLCRRVFGRAAAVSSTTLLALLPVNIAYSRFAWDASQTLLFSLPVIYGSLLAVQRPWQPIRWLLLATACQLAALVVHPTNVFLAPFPALAAGFVFRPLLAAPLRRGGWRWGWLAVAVGSLVAALCLWPWLQLAGRRLVSPLHYGLFAAHYVDLFSGATVFRFLTGAAVGASPTASGLYRLAAGSLFLFGAWGLHREGMMGRTPRLLVGGGALSAAAFFLFAGPGAAAAGNERYAICLVAPGALWLARGLDGWCHRSPVVGQLVCLAAGWMLLVSFYANYFHFVEATGGRAHRTFATAPREPKRAAAIWLKAAAADAPGVTAVATEWWNYWPLAYLTFRDKAIRVVATRGGDAAFGQTAPLPAEVPFLDGFPANSDGGDRGSLRGSGRRLCFVEFAGSPRAEEIADRLSGRGVAVEVMHVPDGGHRPILTVLWPVGG